jgi:ribonuclease-3
MMQRDGGMPNYEYISMEGPPHAPVFYYRVRSGENVLGEGSGSSKQNAQQAAARDALKRMGALS